PVLRAGFGHPSRKSRCTHRHGDRALVLRQCRSRRDRDGDLTEIPARPFTNTFQSWLGAMAGQGRCKGCSRCVAEAVESKSGLSAKTAGGAIHSESERTRRTRITSSSNQRHFIILIPRRKGPLLERPFFRLCLRFRSLSKCAYNYWLLFGFANP